MKGRLLISLLFSLSLTVQAFAGPSDKRTDKKAKFGSNHIVITGVLADKAGKPVSKSGVPMEFTFSAPGGATVTKTSLVNVEEGVYKVDLPLDSDLKEVLKKEDVQMGLTIDREVLKGDLKVGKVPASIYADYSDEAGVADVAKKLDDSTIFSDSVLKTLITSLTDKGFKGEKGAKGEKGDKGDTVVGPAGSAGAKGDTGPQGPKGESPTAAAVATAVKGDVTTALKGDAAFKAAVKGEQGIQGPAGPSTGAAGGDLSGNYPNPTIAAKAVTSDKIATSVAGTGLTGGGGSALSFNYSDTLTSNSLTSGQSEFASTGILFEGATADGNEGLLTVIDPTADRTWALPDASGTIALTTSNVATATKLAANGTNCEAGKYARGVDDSGNAEDCTAVATGTVTSVTASLPLLSSGGDKPNITISDATTSAKGVASFDATDFDVVSGKVSVKSGAITATDLADNSVTSAKIKDGEIVDADISSSAAIADSKLATIKTAGKVSDSALSANVSLLGQSIETSEITNSAVTTDQIASNAITSAKIKDGEVSFSKLAPLNSGNMLVGDLMNKAAAVSMNGDAKLDNTGKLTIENNVVTTAKIANLAVTTGKLEDKAVTTAKLDDKAVTDAKIADGTISFSKMASLTSGNILVGNGSNVATSVAMSGDAMLNNTGSLTLANNAVTADKIKNSAVTAGKIGLDAVLTSAIKDGQVTLAKLGSVDSGKILMGIGTGVTAVTMSGDATMDNAGKVTITSTRAVNQDFFDSRLLDVIGNRDCMPVGLDMTAATSYGLGRARIMTLTGYQKVQLIARARTGQGALTVQIVDIDSSTPLVTMPTSEWSNAACLTKSLEVSIPNGFLTGMKRLECRVSTTVNNDATEFGHCAIELLP